MNIVKCKNGHYFDGEKYNVCPHCGEAVKDAGTTQEETTMGGVTKNSLFGKKKENTNAKIKSLSDKVQGKTLGIFGDKKETPQEESKTSKQSFRTLGKVPDNMRTMPKVPMQSNVDGAEGNMEGRTFSLMQENLEERTPEISMEDRRDAFETQKEQKDDVKKETEQNQISLREQISRVSSSSGGKTVGFFSTGKEDVSDDDDEVVEPVVGWLVCVKGKHFGEAFKIVAGRNSIGRLDSNKIVIRKDNSVSKEKHLWVMYDPKKRDFYVQPGEGSGLAYVEDDIVTETRKLQPFNRIEIGNGLYVIVPLCGDQFTWEDYMEK